MDLLAPFTGTLYLPDKQFLAAGSPVLLGDGQPVAAIKWRMWSQRFDVLDAGGAAIAECRSRGVFRRRYTVQRHDGAPVINLRLGAWRPFNGAELILASGHQLSLRQASMWSDRKFDFYAAGGPLAGRITPTTGVFSFRPDSYAFELLLPVMSALEAISLAQALRLAVRGMRQRRNAGSS